MTNQSIIQSNYPKILIVDDNPQNLQVLGKILQENKYDIEFATNGPAALAWFQKKKFDLILLDINMPEMDGFEVCMKIRSDPEMNNIPVIFLSSDNERNSILKGFELGAQDYITKPFDSRELLVRVKTHLTLKGSLEKLEQLNKSLETKVAERTLQLKEANDKLEATNLKLLELDVAKTTFLNLVSHEIRTPLNGIIGPLELLKEPGYTDDIDDLIKMLDSSVKRLEKFSLSALLITRLKANPGGIRKEIIHLYDIIEELLSESEEFSSKSSDVSLNKLASSDLISGEKELIKKCFFNILNNAIIFSLQNCVVQINLIDEENSLICEISDNGPGFPDSVIKSDFEFFTTGDDYTDNCTGIGLPISKMIMEAHGGTIDIKNNSAGGAVVRLKFKK